MLKWVYTSLLIIQVALKAVWQQLATAVSRHTQDIRWIFNLLEVWWPGPRSARDNHLLPCNFAVYSLNNKSCLMWLIDNPTTPWMVATLLCNLSLMACFLTLLFHKTAWQHTQGVVGSLITTLLQIYCRIVQLKNFENRLRFDIYGHEFGVQFSWPTMYIVYTSIKLLPLISNDLLLLLHPFNSLFSRTTWVS